MSVTEIKSTPEQREYWKAYYQANKEKKKAAAIVHGRQYYAENRDRVRGVHKKYYEQNRERTRVRTAKNRTPEKSSRWNRRAQIVKYGLTVEEYERRFAEQGMRCGVCGETEHKSRNWHIDHCHATGKVRGILCGHCNVGLGNFRDDPTRLHRAVEYLTKWKEK